MQYHGARLGRTRYAKNVLPLVSVEHFEATQRSQIGSYLSLRRVKEPRASSLGVASPRM
jgi:hypothetical protein